MKLILSAPLIIALVGLVAYAISANPKVSELGRISFFAGLLAFLLGLR